MKFLRMLQKRTTMKERLYDFYFSYKCRIKKAAIVVSYALIGFVGGIFKNDIVKFFKKIPKILKMFKKKK